MSKKLKTIHDTVYESFQKTKHKINDKQSRKCETNITAHERKIMLQHTKACKT